MPSFLASSAKLSVTPGPGKTTTPMGRASSRVVAVERRGLGVAGPVRLEDDLRRLAGRLNDYSVPTRFGHREGIVRGYVHEAEIVCGKYEGKDLVFDPLHYLALIEQKINALDQAAGGCPSVTSGARNDNGMLAVINVVRRPEFLFLVKTLF